MPGFWEKFGSSVDFRLALYSGAKQFALVLALGLLIKLFVCDSFKVSGAQMEPAVRQDDRILLFKAPYKIPVIKKRPPRAGKPVVAALPDNSAETLLRIAAVSGDTVSIDNAQLYRNGRPIEKFHKNTGILGVIPAEYSPADFMDTFRVPAPADSMTFAELTLRDLIFAYSVLRQEKSGVSLKAYVLTGDEAKNDYVIKDFALYSGKLDSIPEELCTDWFFWDRLREYLKMTAAEGDTLQLAFTVLKNGKDITGFRVKARYVFLVGDNWMGAKDSRYFGPVVSTNVKGRPLVTLWGFDERDDGKRKLNAKRIFRVVR